MTNRGRVLIVDDEENVVHPLDCHGSGRVAMNEGAARKPAAGDDRVGLRPPRLALRRRAVGPGDENGHLRLGANAPDSGF
jgi:hypothetical protein